MTDALAEYLAEGLAILFFVLAVSALLWLWIEARKDQRDFDRIMREMDKHHRMMQDYLVALGVNAELRRKIDGSRIDNEDAGGADGEATARREKGYTLVLTDSSVTHRLKGPYIPLKHLNDLKFESRRECLDIYIDTFSLECDANVLMQITTMQHEELEDMEQKLNFRRMELDVLYQKVMALGQTAYDEGCPKMIGDELQHARSIIFRSAYTMRAYRTFCLELLGKRAPEPEKTENADA